jgi:cobalamin biosynthesis protein CbiD
MAQSQYIAVDTPKGTRPLVSVKVSDLGDNPTLASVRSKCLV